MTDQKPPGTEQAYKTTWGTFRYFGKLASVENVEGWIRLNNDDGAQVSMKKVYYNWATVFQNAQRLVGKEILIETGSSSMSAGHMMYFRDIVPENDAPEFAGHLLGNLPDPAAFNSKQAWNDVADELIRLRVHRNRLRFAATKHYEENQILVGQMDRLSKAEQDEADKANIALERMWPEFVANPIRHINIAGQNINKSEYLKHIDVAFALRLGIDVTKMKRITVEVIDKIPDKNKIRCVLPEFDGAECLMAIKQSTHNRTNGAWSAATVENTLTGWWKIETKKEYKDVKNRAVTTAEPFLQLHKEIQDIVLAS